MVEAFQNWTDPKLQEYLKAQSGGSKTTVKVGAETVTAFPNVIAKQASDIKAASATVTVPAQQTITGATVPEKRYYFPTSAAAQAFYEKQKNLGAIAFQEPKLSSQYFYTDKTGKIISAAVGTPTGAIDIAKQQAQVSQQAAAKVSPFYIKRQESVDVERLTKAVLSKPEIISAQGQNAMIYPTVTRSEIPISSTPFYVKKQESIDIKRVPKISEYTATYPKVQVGKTLDTTTITEAGYHIGIPLALGVASTAITAIPIIGPPAALALRLAGALLISKDVGYYSSLGLVAGTSTGAEGRTAGSILRAELPSTLLEYASFGVGSRAPSLIKKVGMNIMYKPSSTYSASSFETVGVKAGADVGFIGGGAVPAITFRAPTFLAKLFGAKGKVEVTPTALQLFGVQKPAMLQIFSSSLPLTSKTYSGAENVAFGRDIFSGIKFGTFTPTKDWMPIQNLGTRFIARPTSQEYALFGGKAFSAAGAEPFRGVSQVLYPSKLVIPTETRITSGKGGGTIRSILLKGPEAKVAAQDFGLIVTKTKTIPRRGGTSNVLTQLADMYAKEAARPIVRTKTQVSTAIKTGIGLVPIQTRTTQSKTGLIGLAGIAPLSFAAPKTSQRLAQRSMTVPIQSIGTRTQQAQRIKAGVSLGQKAAVRSAIGQRQAFIGASLAAIQPIDISRTMIKEAKTTLGTRFGGFGFIPTPTTSKGGGIGLDIGYPSARRIGRRRKKVSVEQKRGYTPSLIAILLGIRGRVKRGRKYTGLELRPIPSFGSRV